MMEFQDGQYSLSTESGCNKSVFFVKLTDSALHSIESFLQAKDEETKPTIQFEGNNGTITVPQNGQKIYYGFTLSNLKADGSSFQCLQHTTKKSLKSLASMRMKMQVHANEDSYANTKCKMAAVEKEQKSLCTKEIKPNGTKLVISKPYGKFLSKKSKFKHPGGVFPVKAVPFVKAQEHSGFLKPREIPNKSVLSKEPIRKRIIHILAIKSFKKPDITLKLMKDGISDEDKSSVPEILKEVAVCKNKVYTLSKHLWNEVEDDWKFYSKEELEVIHRKKQNFLELNGITTSKKQNNVKKGYVNKSESLDEPQSKRQKTSLNNNHKGNQSNVKAGASELNSVSTVKTNGILNDLKIPSPNQANGHSENNELSVEKRLQLLYDSINNGRSPELDLYNEKNSKKLPKDLVATLMELSKDKITSNPSMDDVAKSPNRWWSVLPKLDRITTHEQRAEYTRRFNSMYTDYLELHKKMKEIAGKALYLEDQLNLCEVGSADYKLLKQEIYKVYCETALDFQYRSDWDTFHKLHNILEDIKRLVTEYDNEAS